MAENLDVYVQTLIDSDARGSLREGLYRVLTEVVPQDFSCTEGGNYQPNADWRTLKILSRYFLDNSDPKAGLQKLRENDNPPEFCGKAFRSGEPTYTCRDCALDPSCVLCMQCFDKSEHKQHKYRMSTSGGGGYCDCGDPDAWKRFPACSTHVQSSTSNKQDPIELLPFLVRKRASSLFELLLKYIVRVLQLESGPLPEDLFGSLIESEQHHVILYNDEVHTYDQVINNLVKATGCSKKDATDFATQVDREGRTCVYSSTLSACQEIAPRVARSSRNLNSRNPLKVVILPESVLLHQHCALSLLHWLENLITQSDGLRRLFCMISMDPLRGVRIADKLSLLEEIFLSDTSYWKTIRQQFHQLYMVGVFKDVESKITCGSLFTKHYSKIYDDFIHDDHFRSVSVTSLSVQIYTVPTIVRELMQAGPLISKILEPVISEAQTWIPDLAGVPYLKFPKNADHMEKMMPFKRAQFALYDLKYLLQCGIPTEWNDTVRNHFLGGFSTFLTLLNLYQDMDGCKRYETSHIEMEPEWETAFNLQVKLHDCITLILDWCTSDALVWQQSLELLENKISPNIALQVIARSVGSHTTQCSRTPVGREDVKTSVHLPLHRLMTGLLVQAPTSFINHLKQTQIQPENERFVVELMEKPLNVLTMLAQVQADMWKRNGFSILNQIYYYQNVKCRDEMYDRDVQMLQIAASIIKPDDFLIHILSKFCLIQLVTTGKQSIPADPVLLEELLCLVIHILSERYVTGLSKVDKDEIVQREIIHQLAMNKMSHSDLNKALPEDPNHETRIEQNVAQVADFSRSGNNKGMYTLKSEYLKQFNPMFYHYTKQEQSKAEAAVRDRLKDLGKSEVLVVPRPPPFLPAYSSILSLLTSDTLFLVFHACLPRYFPVPPRSEPHVERVLHLITLGLHEQTRGGAPSHGSDRLFTDMCKLPLRKNALVSRGTESQPISLVQVLENIRVESPTYSASVLGLLKVTLDYFYQVSSLGGDPMPIQQEMKAPELPEDGEKQRLEQEKQDKAARAAKQRAKIAAKMVKMQKKFMRENMAMFSSIDPNESFKQPDEAPATPTGSREDSVRTALGPKPSKPMTSINDNVCILCQEASNISDGNNMLYPAYIQRSTVLSRNRTADWRSSCHNTPRLVTSDLVCGNIVSSCAHPMHVSCWQSYFDRVIEKEQRRAHRVFLHLAPLIFDFHLGEYLCPLCESIANTTLPLLPSIRQLRSDSDHTLSDRTSANRTDGADSGQAAADISLSIDDWLAALARLSSTPDTPLPLSTPENCPLPEVARLAADRVYSNFMEFYRFLSESLDEDNLESIDTQTMTKFLETNMRVLVNGSTANSSLQGTLSLLNNSDLGPTLWNTAAYTIQVTEALIRSDTKPLFGHLAQRYESCLQLLVRFSALCLSSSLVSHRHIQEYSLQLLNVLLEPTRSPTPDDLSDAQPLPRLFDLDLWHMLVTLTFALPSLFSHTVRSALTVGGVNEQYILHTILSAHIARLLLTYDPSAEGQAVAVSSDDLPPGTEPMDCDEFQVLPVDEGLLKIYRNFLHVLGKPNLHEPSSHELTQFVLVSSLPLLRCATLLFRNLTDVREPSELRDRLEPMDEYSTICTYLALPTRPSELFTPSITSLLTQHVTKLRQESVSRPVSYTSRVNQLIELPHHYSDLVNKTSAFTCPRSNSGDEESRTPTLCLVCGQMLCSQSYCCQVESDGDRSIGAATYHTQTCGAGNGIFLRVRQCQVLLLSGKNKGCFIPAPYIDEYGETDPNLKRGNPMFLNKSSYADLHRLWLSHGIADRATRSMSHNSGHFMMGADWGHL